MDLSGNLRAIVSQRLVRTADGKGRAAAIEILLNTPTIAEQDLQGRVPRDQGDHGASRASSACAPSTGRCSSSTTKAHIAYDEAIRNADSANELRLNIKLKSTRGEPAAAAGLALAMDDMHTPEKIEALRQDELRKQQHKREELELAALQRTKLAQQQPSDLHRA